MSQREEFEKVISKSPYELSIARHGAESAWPGNYKDYKVQLAYDVVCCCTQKQSSEIERLKQRVAELEQCARYESDVAEQAIQRMKELEQSLQGFLAIVSDSKGVAGYHLNGAIAEWDEFEEVDAARKALGDK